MPRLLSILLLASACSVDHTGLGETTGVDTGPIIDGGANRDARMVDAQMLDAPIPDVAEPDVTMSDGGPDVPLPTGCEYYVSRNGNDSADGRTPDTPLRSLKMALDLTPSVICVGQGNFDQELPITSSIRIRGSFCDGFASQSTSECLTTIRSPTFWGVFIDGEGRLAVGLEFLQIETANATNPGESTYGIRVVDTDLTITNVHIVTGDAADGAPGEVGAVGANGSNGSNGEFSPGGGGTNCRSGGAGGGYVITTAQPGDDASGASGENGRGGDPGRNGQNGTNGADAPNEPAAPGAGALGIGALSNECLYLPTEGERGATGMAGFGGGGGGASDERARVGGGGGGGGCGGAGGGGGGGGGGSFGIAAVESRVVVMELSVELGDGGDGGDGSAGGAGGEGGQPGSGASLAGFRGGNGGRGGAAGRGGIGGGGAGGPVAAILRGDSELIGVPQPEIISGGGQGGGGGGDGADGVSGGNLSVDVRTP